LVSVDMEGLLGNASSGRNILGDLPHM